MNLEDILIVIWLHFVADFLLQTRAMATNKSSNNGWLFIHCVVYSLPFLYFGWLFAVINGLAHFLTDFVTSKVTTKLYAVKNWYGFFGVIGFDQAVHITTLLLTLEILIWV